MWHRLSSSSKLNLRTCALGLGFLTRSFSSEPGKRFAALWGNGDYGRLGLGNLNSQWKPAICTSFLNQNVQAIACGGAHTLFLTGSLSLSLFLLSIQLRSIDSFFASSMMYVNYPSTSLAYV